MTIIISDYYDYYDELLLIIMIGILYGDIRIYIYIYVCKRI